MREGSLGSAPCSGNMAALTVADWKSVGAQARVYLVAGAWQSAHDLLWPHVQFHWTSPAFPPEGLECLSLCTISCARLNHAAHLTKAHGWLSRAFLQHGKNLPPEAATLTAYCLARQAADAGKHESARKWIALLGEETILQSSPWAQARLSSLLGRIATREGNLGAAEHYGTETARLAELAGSETLRGDAFALLAIVARMRGALGEANTLYAKAATHYWQSGNMTGHVTVLLNRAWTLGLIGMLPDSKRLFKESLSTAVSLGRQSTALRARLGLAWVCARGGNLREARSRLLSVWRETRRRSMLREETLALEYLAETYILSGALTKAKVPLRLGRRLAQRLAPDGDLTLEIQIREAMLSLAEGRWSDAISQSKAAIEHARRITMPWELAQALRLLGTAYLHLPRRRQARDAFRKAQSLLVQMNEQLERHVVTAWLSALGQQPPSSPHGSVSRALDAADAVPSELHFWLHHPLLGPGPWTCRTQGRGRGSHWDVTCGSSGRVLCADDSATPAASDGQTAGALYWTEVTADSKDAGSNCGYLQGSVAPIWSDLGLITRSPELLMTLRLAETYARGTIPILVTGETGSGKDLLIRGLHVMSDQSGRFVPVNCAAARKDLFVAELFGARKGAYTGAVEHRSGLIEAARDGTIFFDEIADLEPEAQGFLLRFLDSGEIRPLGATRRQHVTARVAAATCQDLSEHVRAGLFRADLYGRLAGVVLRIPPLRQRKDDLELLAEMLWQREGGNPIVYRKVFTSEVLDNFRQRFWAGNVRELKYAAGRAVLFSRTHGSTAAMAYLLQEGDRQRIPIVEHSMLGSPCISRRQVVAMETNGRSHPHRRGKPSQWTVERLRAALEATGGQVPEAGKILGISRSYAYQLYKRLGFRKC